MQTNGLTFFAGVLAIWVESAGECATIFFNRFGQCALETMPATEKGCAKRTSRNVSQYGIRNGKAFKCRTDVVKGLTFITRLG